MALTNAEKVRRYRERQKEKKQQELKMPEAARPSIFQTPFHQFFEEWWFGSDYDIALGLAGIETPVFKDDAGPQAYKRGNLPEGEDFHEHAQNSLGRAEVIAGCLITAAQDLASWINEYKKDEIKQRLKELEERDLSDPEAKKAALQEATRLNKMLDQLQKQVRITFPQWKATG